MSSQLPSFRDAIEELVSKIPEGRLMTYGQIAALCGSPRSSRIVGGIAHFGNPNLPWYRVVNRIGGLASGYPGGKIGHKIMLEQEGFTVKNFQVNIKTLIWWPEE